jgi:hypothetical protein
MPPAWRQYSRQHGGGTMVRLFNFLCQVHGLRSFRYEYQRARRLKWLGTEVAVLPLERIYASKKFLGRPKDLAHLPLLKQTMKLLRRIV